MFVTLLIVTVLTAFSVALLVALLFRRPLRRVLARLVGEELGPVWHRYLMFAICVVGTGGGVNVRSLERYILPQDKGGTLLVLNGDRWTLEIYQTVIGALQSTAWILLLFFVCALIAYVIVRAREARPGGRAPEAAA